jgi:O-antigen ligase
MEKLSSMPWRSAMAAIRKVAWVLFLVCLPITSFPYFPAGIGGGTLVRPLSIYPMLVLLLIVVIPDLITKPVPKTLIALLPFVLVTVASSAISMLRDIEPALGISVLDRTVRGLATLGIGVAFYYTVTLVPHSFEDLRNTMHWIYAGFSLAMLWGSIQAIYILKYIPAYFHKLDALQRFVSTRKLFQTRISGLTYEPNWYAEQISILLLPWLLASVLSGYSVFRWRWHKITVEWFLLAWSTFNLAFTFSRAGYLNAIILVVLCVLVLRPWLRHSEKPVLKFAKPWRRIIFEIVALIGILLVGVFVVGRKNAFFSRLWNFWSEKSDRSLASYIEYIGFGARVTYAETALQVYQAYPIIGVGPSNYAFFFVEMMPERPLAITPELLKIVLPEMGRTRLITPKNLYLRILAETGILGMATYLVFFIAIIGCALYLLLSANLEFRYWGISGLLGLIVIAIAANSFDSFALPNMWVVYGLITAATSITDKNAHIKSNMAAAR